jgi:hypothetical protein
MMGMGYIHPRNGATTSPISDSYSDRLLPSTPHPSPFESNRPDPTHRSPGCYFLRDKLKISPFFSEVWIGFVSM